MALVDEVHAVWVALAFPSSDANVHFPVPEIQHFGQKEECAYRALGALV